MSLPQAFKGLSTDTPDCPTSLRSRKQRPFIYFWSEESVSQTFITKDSINQIMSGKIKEKRKEILLKQLKLKKSKSSSKRKFIVVQIDGLGFDTLQRVRQTKHMPFLRKFVQENKLTQWSCGFPSTRNYVRME
jgi:hypothetical protein